jgi:hypothetical protein
LAEASERPPARIVAAISAVAESDRVTPGADFLSFSILLVP